MWFTAAIDEGGGEVAASLACSNCRSVSLFSDQTTSKNRCFSDSQMARASKSLLLVNIKSMILRVVSVHLWCLFWFWLIC